MLMFSYILALPTQAFDLEAVSMFLFLLGSLFQRRVCWLLFTVPWQPEFKTTPGKGREECRSRETPGSELRPKTLSLITACTKTWFSFCKCLVCVDDYHVFYFFILCVLQIKFFRVGWFFAFSKLILRLFLFLSRVQTEKIASPLTFLPVSPRLLLLSHLWELFLPKGTENTAERRSESVNLDSTLWHDRNNDQFPVAISDR